MKSHYDNKLKFAYAITDKKRKMIGQLITHKNKRNNKRIEQILAYENYYSISFTYCIQRMNNIEKKGKEKKRLCQDLLYQH